MTEIKFDELCRTIEVIGNSFISKSSDSIIWSSRWQDAVRNSYEPDKEQLKRQYAKSADELLDRHKVAAVLLRSICLSRPLKPADGRGYTPRTETINAKLGFHTSVFVVQRYAKQDAIDAGDSIGQQCHSQSLIFPAALNGDGSYEEQTLKMLHQASAKGQLDVLMLANLLFVLDSYHRAAWQPAALGT